MAARQIRIFQIAKDLNISHTEILTFLKSKGVEVASHMSPVDKETQDMIQVEFHKEREDIDRFRKVQVGVLLLSSHLLIFLTYPFSLEIFHIFIGY